MKMHFLGFMILASLGLSVQSFALTDPNFPEGGTSSGGGHAYTVEKKAIEKCLSKGQSQCFTVKHPTAYSSTYTLFLVSGYDFMHAQISEVDLNRFTTSYLLSK